MVSELEGSSGTVHFTAEADNPPNFEATRSMLKMDQELHEVCNLLVSARHRC